MDSHISAVVKSSYYQPYRLGKIRKRLTTSATKTMVHSLVISHLDYANSLFAGLPTNSSLFKQFRIQQFALATTAGHSRPRKQGTACSQFSKGLTLRSSWWSLTVLRARRHSTSKRQSTCTSQVIQDFYPLLGHSLLTFARLLAGDCWGERCP